MTNKKIQNALVALEYLKNELKGISNESDGDTWKAHFKELLEEYVGPKSNFITRLNDMEFTVQSVGSTRNTLPFLYDSFSNETKPTFISLIETVKSHIKIRGLYKVEHEGNFLSNYSIWTIVSVFLGALSVSFSIGLYLGALSKDREVAAVERQLHDVDELNKKLEEQIKPLEINKRN